MLPLDKLRERLKDCADREVMWRPVHARAMLTIPLVDEGMVGGAFVPGSEARHKFQAIVLRANNCREIKDGDVIWFDAGHGEELTTVRGETFFYITESNASGLDDEFWSSRERKTESGLWVAGV